MKTDRLLAMLTLLLSRRTSTAGELAEHFEVSVRTVYRDIEALSLAGIPIYTQKGRSGGVRLAEGFTLDRALLTPDQQKDLAMALSSLRAMRHPGMDSLLETLGALRMRPEEDWIHVLFTGWEDAQEEHFYLLRDCILSRRTVQLAYAGANGEVSHRVIEPLRLITRGGGWYISAFCRERQDFRTFRLSRIKSAQQLTEQFTRREPPDAPIADGPEKTIKLLLRFHPMAEFRVMDEYPHQDILRMEDGYMHVRCEYPDNAWVLSHLLSFGNLLEVLSPQTMRKAIIEQAENLLSLYKLDR